MTLHATKGDSLPGLPHRADTVQHGVDTKLLVVGPAFFVGLGQPVHRRGYQIIDRRIG